ncbi:MAG TPA: cupredoxin domain-containing protein [Candidatus Limnocylindrales bacterium]|nr:cupredoxin domain-containing protein [Candidatus Limnocylindrales bacterium]
MQELWDRILDLLAQLVIPDWTALVGIIPLVLAGLIGVFLVWVVWRYATAGPKSRTIPPASPRPPAGIHAPAPSFAPIILAMGAFALFGATVVGGFAALALGLSALSLGLLYWGREAIAEYLHVEHVAMPALPVVVHPSPPPGVHEPAPSFRPFLGAYATMVLFAGLVFGPAGDPDTGELSGWPALLIAGIVMFAIALIGWLGDFRREYRATEDADRGHAHHDPPPRVPKGTLALFAVITIAAGCVQFGIIPPAGSDMVADTSPSPAASEVPADATVVAEGIKFLTTDVAVPADRPFGLELQNKDQGIEHNVRIRDAAGAVVFDGQLFAGIANKVYQVSALAPGAYPFDCKVHPIMTGTLTAGG